MFRKSAVLRLGLAVLIALLAPASLSASGLFKKVKTYNSGGFFPMSVALADVNLDGKPDLVIANWCMAGQNGQGCRSGGVVGVLLSNGDGTFQSAKSFGSGAMGAISVAVADVNGDAKPDILVANACNIDPQLCLPDGVGVLLGNGDGTFQTARIYALDLGEGGASSIAVTDVNRDGKPDLLVGGQGGDHCPGPAGVIWVGLGNGDGSFQAAQTYYSGGSCANSIAVADVNGDSKPDLLVANGCAIDNCLDSGLADVLLGNGDGTLQAAVGYHSGQGAVSVAVADVNGDGKGDLLVANRGCYGCGGSVGVLLGNGDGTFQAVNNYNSGGFLAFTMAVQDVNKDGKLDLLVVNCGLNESDCIHHSATDGPGEIGVLLGNGDGSFQTAQMYYSGGKGVAGIAVGDVNGDSKPDLAVTNWCPKWGDCSSGLIGVLLAEPYSTTTNLTSRPNPSVQGQTVTLTATVTSSGPVTPTGRVTFKSGGTAIGSRALTSATSSAVAVAKLQTTNLPVGTLSITAVYHGDTQSAKSTSPVVIQVVNPAARRP
jgi:hypothetical protein